MGKTFDQSLIDTATIPMSMIDPDDMADTSSEEFLGLRRVQQGCHSELINKEEFPFQIFSKTLTLTAGVGSYSLPAGKIKEVYIAGNSKPLTYVDDYRKLPDNVASTPRYYAIKPNPEKLMFCPAPDRTIEASIDYIDTRSVINTDGSYGYEITIGSTLRMPERIQYLYFDALEYYVLATNMRKQSNPRWQPTLEIFKERWQIFLNSCKKTDSETYFVI